MLCVCLAGTPLWQPGVLLPHHALTGCAVCTPNAWYSLRRWQTRYVLYYPNTAGDVQVLGNNITRRMGANLLGPHPQSGAFLDSCWHHCGMWDRIRIDGELVSTAFAKWYDGLGQFGESIPPKTLWAQKKAYECDDCCKP